MKFTIIEFIREYAKVGDEFQWVEVKKKYEAHNWDDMQNLLMTLIDFADGSIRFEVRKEAIDEQ